MGTWTADAVLDEAARWLWVPDFAAQVETEEYLVVGYPQTWENPASSGGCTRVGRVARLWGAGTRPSLRGRGAYRAVLAHRVVVAHGLGATLALVKGRVGTSAPILRRLGFTAYGQEHLYRVDASA